MYAIMNKNNEVLALAKTVEEIHVMLDVVVGAVKIRWIKG